MRASIRLGRLAGIPIGMNLGALVVIALLAVGLAVGRFPAAYPGRPGWAYALAGTAAAVLFVAGLLVHEMAHALVAKANGITVAQIVLWLLGGVAELRGEARTPGTEFAVAVVGPLASLGLGGAWGAVALGLDAAGVRGLPVATAGYLAATNVVIAVFNLLPAAPLDGGRVLRAAVWRFTGDRVRAAVVASRAGRLLGLGLIALGIAQALFVGGFGGWWLAIIGWFLVHAATAEERMAVAGRRLHGLRVRDVMTPDPATAPAETTVAEFIAHFVMAHPFSTYPLVDADGRLTGLVTLNRLRAVPLARRAATRLADIACPAGDVPVAESDEPLTDLLTRMSGCTDGRAVVVDGARVVGLVSPSDVSRAAARAELRDGDPYPPRGADLHRLPGS